MKITEIIRGILDLIDRVEQESSAVKNTDPEPADTAYSDQDIKRFRQIVDLASQETAAPYANQPQEQYADIDSVTVDAGADSVNGTKHPADIRGEHPSLYLGTGLEKKHG